MTSTPNLSLPFIEAGQAQKHVTHNEALRSLDAVVQLAVGGITANPPTSPAEGERHIVGADASDAFAGHENEVAAFQDGAWRFFPPHVGWRAWRIDDAKLLVWTETAWSEVSSGEGGGGSGDVVGPQGNVSDGDIAVFSGTSGKSIQKARGAIDYLGVGTSPDPTSTDNSNRLAVRASSALFHAIPQGESPGTGDIKVQISKEAAGNSASFFFSTNFSGRAEFGLVEGDAFKLKISADGLNWTEAMSFDPTTGAVDLGPSKASSADIAAAVANKIVTADRLKVASAPVAIAEAGAAPLLSLANLDWDRFINGLVTLTANRQIGNPINGQPGTYRTILVQGNNSTDRAISFGNQFLGDLPTITDCDNTKWYLITLFCVSASHFVATAVVAKKP
jgi:hypothetical protein